MAKTAAAVQDPYDFSVVLGGPLYQLWRRARLAGDGLELLRRRVIAMLRQASDALRVLRSPSKLLRLFGGNLLTQILFAISFAVSAQAFDVLPVRELMVAARVGWSSLLLRDLSDHESDEHVVLAIRSASATSGGFFDAAARLTEKNADGTRFKSAACACTNRAADF